MDTWLLEPSQPFDFGLSLAYLQRRAGEMVDRVENHVYRRLLTLDEGMVLLEVKSEGSRLRIRLPWWEDGVCPERVTLYVRRVFSLDIPLADFYEGSKHDPPMHALHQRFYGLRPVLTGSPFEALIWAIVGQQITLSFAFILKGRLVQRFGLSRQIQNLTYWTFPSPESLAAASPDELRSMQFTQRKAEYITALARDVAHGTVDLARLQHLSVEAAVDRLIRLRGVGRWTAEYVLMRGLGAQDALPAADIGLRNAVSIIYGLDHQASETEVREHAAAWTGWRSYGALYLWATLWKRE